MRTIAAVLVLLAAPHAAAAQGSKPNWNQVSNIKEAAVRLAGLQREQGALAAFQFIAACYKTHTLASSYNKSLEGCLVHDILHSRSTAAVYSRLTPEQRKETGVPDPELLTSAMVNRVQGALAQYKFAQADAEALVRLVDQHGMPEFVKARFPVPKTQQ
jgi:hypothetical protein